MNSHSRHSVTGVTLPHLFRPAEIAEALGCSEWWVKEQARQRRIPFTRAGGAYRFTAEHLVEIIAIFEERPIGGTSRSAGHDEPARTQRSGKAVPAVRLRARAPRRSQSQRPAVGL
ncbi:helix-turn-helix domain-containing protein [Streptomyces luteireticuli]|uniref:helix-turn-helix domain-containing protein n=1 Tax=Streptomyces luteireticuli TaxID=173858 RepID=UPI003558BECB